MKKQQIKFRHQQVIEEDRVSSPARCRRMEEALRAFVAIHECRDDTTRDDYEYAYWKACDALLE